MQHFREAEKLADINRNSEEWANLQDAIADLLFAQGNYSDAEKLFRGVIELRSRVLGPEHPDTLASRHRLIYALNEEEKHVRGRSGSSPGGQVCGKRFSASNIRILFSAATTLPTQSTTRVNMRRRNGPTAQVLKLDEKVIGPEHQRTLAARIGLANALNDQGKYAEAIASYHDVIRLDEKVYGPEHPVTLNDRMDLATALQAKGHYLEAEAEYKTVIKLQEKVIGPEHAYTLNTRNNLAEVLDDEGKYAEAEAECRQIIDLEKRWSARNTV